MKRKTMALLLALSMCLSLLSACGSDNTATDDKPSESENTVSSTGQQPEESEKPEESMEPTEEVPEESEEPEESTEPVPAVPTEMTYTFDAATGTLTCSGGGEVVQSDWLDVVKNTIFETSDILARAEVKKVVVESGITSLGDGAFKECKNLAEVTLPDTLTRIGDRALQGASFTSIAIPESVTEFGTNVFNDCKNLASVNLPGSLTEIPDKMFDNCKSLTHIEIPAGVTKIGGGAFQDSGLTELTIPEGVTTIGSDIMSRTQITSLIVPASLTEWSSGFYGYAQAVVLEDITFLCEATMDNVESLVYPAVEMSYFIPMTIHAPAGSVIEGYVNRQIQNGWTNITFVPID